MTDSLRNVPDAGPGHKKGAPPTEQRGAKSLRQKQTSRKDQKPDVKNENNLGGDPRKGQNGPRSAAQSEAPRARAFDCIAEKRVWVDWALVRRGQDCEKHPRIPGTKTPAKVSEPSTWGTRADCTAENIGVIFNGDGRGGIDLDACRNPATGEIASWAREFLDKFKKTYAEVSPSGTGVKIFADGAPSKFKPNKLVIDAPAVDGKSAQVEAYVTRRFFAVTGQQLEGHPDLVAACPEAWTWLAKRMGRKKPSGTVGKPLTSARDAERDAARKRLAALAEQISVTPEGDRDTALNSACFELGTYVAHGLLERDEVEERLRAAGLACGLEPNVVDEKLRRSIEDGAAKSEGFTLTQRGQVRANVDNTRHGLRQLGAKLSYNEFSDQFLIDGVPGLGPVVDDHVELQLRMRVNDEFKFYPGRELAFEVITSEALENKFHPVRDYLDSRTWDGTDRLDRWLVDHAGADDTEFNRAVGRIMLVAAVRRVRQPGCKFDEMPVLEGPQGINKSSALRLLAVRDEWFSDSLSLQVVSRGDDKKAIEQLAGKWIVEVPELNGLRDSQVEGLKSFLSRQVDSARLSYARRRSDVKRQAIVVGTTNSSEYLHDETGNRRIWPVKVQQFNLETLTRDRDQLWAEAVAREAAGESIRLPQELWAAAAVEQDRRVVNEAWADVLAPILGDLEGKVAQSDVWEILGVSPAHVDKRKAERLRDALALLGFEKKKLRFGRGVGQVGFVKGKFATKFERDSCPRIIFTVEPPPEGSPPGGRGGWVAELEQPPPPALALVQGSRD